MPSIDDQIKKYQSAVGHRNVGSDPSAAQINNAKNTSIGNIRGTISRRSSTEGGATAGEPRMSVSAASKARPSWEGYMHAPKTLISSNDSGYLSKASQKARFKDKEVPIPRRLNQDQAKPKASSRNITDYRLKGSGRDSASKLRKLSNLKKII